jgi:hypothetical protein
VNVPHTSDKFFDAIKTNKKTTQDSIFILTTDGYQTLLRRKLPQPTDYAMTKHANKNDDPTYYIWNRESYTDSNKISVLKSNLNKYGYVIDSKDCYDNAYVCPSLYISISEYKHMIKQSAKEENE